MQLLLSLQTVKVGKKVSGGHSPDLPVHVSGMSQLPDARRQMVSLLLYFTAHTLLVPSHTARAWHTVKSAHWKPDGSTASAGQSPETPVHVSGISQSPSALRHTVEEEARVSVGHVVLLPEHVSSMSHGPEDLRHTVPARYHASGGQLKAEPAQVSAGSHEPFDFRHTKVGACANAAGHEALWSEINTANRR